MNTFAPTMRSTLHSFSIRPHTVSDVHLILAQQGHVLLLERRPLHGKPASYSVPTSRLYSGQMIRETALCAGYEELGVIIRPEDLQVVHVMREGVDDEHRVSFFVMAQRWEGEPMIMNDRIYQDIDWFLADYLPTNAHPHLNKVVSYIHDGVTYSEFNANQ